MDTHENRVSDILFNILNLFFTLFFRETVHVEDAHLLDNRGLSRFTSTQKQQTMGGSIKLENKSID